MFGLNGIRKQWHLWGREGGIEIEWGLNDGNAKLFDFSLYHPTNPLQNSPNL